MLLAAGQRDRARAAFSRARQADPAFLPALARLKQLAAAPAEP
jgi:Tfp pilus assembly protein PilF